MDDPGWMLVSSILRWQGTSLVCHFNLLGWERVVLSLCRLQVIVGGGVFVWLFFYLFVFSKMNVLPNKPLFPGSPFACAGCRECRRDGQQRVTCSAVGTA